MIFTEIKNKTIADIIVDLLHLSKNSSSMYRLAQQQEAEIDILNSENQAMIKFLGEELPNKYKQKIVAEYKDFIKNNYPRDLNKLDVDDKKAINNLTSNQKGLGNLLNQSKKKPLLKALSKLTK